MPKIKPKPKPKVKRGVFKTKAGKKCPVDARELIFYPELTKWKCPRSECGYMEYPDIGTGVPIHAKGRNSLVITKDDTGDMAYFIVSENSIFMPVSVENIEFRDDGLPTITVPITEVVKI